MRKKNLKKTRKMRLFAVLFKKKRKEHKRREERLLMGTNGNDGMENKKPFYFFSRGPFSLNAVVGWNN